MNTNKTVLTTMLTTVLNFAESGARATVLNRG